MLMIPGNINVRDDFSLYMEVFPSPLNHNGILLSVGTSPNFGYYEWKTKAVHVQFLVLEFLFSAVSVFQVLICSKKNKKLINSLIKTCKLISSLTSSLINFDTTILLILKYHVGLNVLFVPVTRVISSWSSLMILLIV